MSRLSGACGMALLPATLYAALLARWLMGQPCPWGSACVLPAAGASLTALRWIVALVLLAHGLVVPGWLAALRMGIPHLARLGCAVPLSVAISFCLHTILHLAGLPRTFASAGTAIAGFEVLLVWMCRRRGTRFTPAAAEWAAIAGALSIIAFIGPGRIATQSLDGDGVEAFSFAASLSHRLLPHWDLENGTWGFYPTFMSFAYPLNLSLSLLGPSEAAMRLPVIFLAAGFSGLVGAGHGGAMRGALMVASIVAVTTSALNYTYEPYAAGVAEPTVTDLYFTLSLLMTLWAWHHRRLGLSAVAAALAVTGQPAGLPFLALLIIGGALDRTTRGFALRVAVILVAILLCLAGADLLWNPAGVTKFSVTAFVAHHTRTLSLRLGARQAATQIWALLVQTSGAPLLFLAAYVRDLRRGGPRIVLYVAIAIYLLAVVLSPKRHPHYLTPVAAMLLFMIPHGTRLPRVWPALIVGALAGVLLPRGCPADTRAAEFGRATLMVVPTEREAVENADLLYRVLTVPPWRDEDQWGLGKHAWVLYSARSETMPRFPPEGVHVLLTHEPHAWDAFVPVTDNGRGYLYESPPGWMEEWRLQGGTNRCWGWLLKIPGRLWDPISRWETGGTE